MFLFSFCLNVAVLLLTLLFFFFNVLHWGPAMEKGMVNIRMLTWPLWKRKCSIIFSLLLGALVCALCVSFFLLHMRHISHLLNLILILRNHFNMLHFFFLLLIRLFGGVWYVVVVLISQFPPGRKVRWTATKTKSLFLLWPKEKLLWWNGYSMF